jgi:hypothetical protein
MTTATPAPYDSRADTLIHSQRVGELMVAIAKEVLDRSTCHDRSKTLPPEVEVFDEFTPKLKNTTYGSDGYRGHLAAMGEGLKHHYAVNRHHPEHFADGVNDMTLADLVEMLADWKAATERHDDGSLSQSLEIQRERFGLSDQLAQILRNTARWFGWLDSSPKQDAQPVDLEAVERRALDVAQGEIESWDSPHMIEVLDASQRDVAPLVAEVKRSRAEITRLRAGAADDLGDEAAVPTTGQWIARFLAADADGRVRVAEHLQRQAAEAGQCFILDDAGRLQDLQDRTQRLNALLREVLSGSVWYEYGYPGRPCVRTGWTSVEQLHDWRTRAGIFDAEPAEEVNRVEIEDGG